MRYLSAITHCSVGLFHQQTGRTPDRSRPRRRPTLRRPGPRRSRPKAPGRRRRGDITGEEM